MTEPQPGRGTSPGTAPEGPLQTAAEVAAARLAETAAAGQAVAPGAGGMAGVIRRHPTASLLIGLGVGWLVGRGKAAAPTGASPPVTPAPPSPGV